MPDELSESEGLVSTMAKTMQTHTAMVRVTLAARANLEPLFPGLAIAIRGLAVVTIELEKKRASACAIGQPVTPCP